MTPQKIAELIELTVTPHGSKTRFGVYMDAESWGVVMKSLRASPGEAMQLPPEANELAAMMRDAARYRACLKHGFPMRNQTPTNEGLQWTVHGEWFGSTPTAAIDDAMRQSAPEESK